ncbi:MAG: hypothetical protein IPK22_28780 [Verrucomicrobiaceae bacterium]|nr:hypothetical protein [Verrucomicrobiaceae bacterium]
MKPSTKLLIVFIPLLVLGTLFVSKVLKSGKNSRQHDTASQSPLPTEGHEKGAYSPASLARDQCRKITNALRTFHARRGLRPVPEGSPTDETHVFAIDEAMLDALSGKDSAGVNYLKAAGFTAPVPEGSFYAAFDFNGDGSIPDPSAPDKMVSQDILVWSHGEDGNPETWADNAFAWLQQ